MSETRQYLEGIFSGQIPVKRKNPQTGIEEDVYYNYDDNKEELVKLENKEIPLPFLI